LKKIDIYHVLFSRRSRKARKHEKMKHKKELTKFPLDSDGSRKPRIILPSHNDVFFIPLRHLALKKHVVIFAFFRVFVVISQLSFHAFPLCLENALCGCALKSVRGYRGFSYFVFSCFRVFVVVFLIIFVFLRVFVLSWPIFCFFNFVFSCLRGYLFCFSNFAFFVVIF